MPTPIPPSAVGIEWLDGVVAAVLTPFDLEGRPHVEEIGPYVARLRDCGVSGVAVGVHTGRGDLLSGPHHRALVSAAAGSGLPVVAGVTLPAGQGPLGRAEVERHLLERALPLRDAGASALLCFPPPADTDADPGWLAHLHHLLGERTGLPVIAFVLYEAAAGNVTYGPEQLTAITSVPEVVAVKVAVLDDAIRCQDTITHLRATAPHVRVLTGEDRMFGPSLMWGAQGALVGIAAARPELSVHVLHTWQEGRLADFHAASTALDAFARLTFGRPVRGYVQRQAWVAARDGLLPDALCHDPAADEVILGERDAFVRALGNLATVGAHAQTWSGA